jgi:hypothetical protein
MSLEVLEALRPPQKDNTPLFPQWGGNEKITTINLEPLTRRTVPRNPPCTTAFHFPLSEILIAITKLEELEEIVGSVDGLNTIEAVKSAEVAIADFDEDEFAREMALLESAASNFSGYKSLPMTPHNVFCACEQLQRASVTLPMLLRIEDNIAVLSQAICEWKSFQGRNALDVEQFVKAVEISQQLDDMEIAMHDLEEQFEIYRRSAREMLSAFENGPWKSIGSE